MVNGKVSFVGLGYVDSSEGIVMTQGLDEALREADCVSVVTAHDEYRKIELQHMKGLMKTPIIVDGRNVFDK